MRQCVQHFCDRFRWQEASQNLLQDEPVFVQPNTYGIEQLAKLVLDRAIALVIRAKRNVVTLFGPPFRHGHQFLVSVGFFCNSYNLESGTGKRTECYCSKRILALHLRHEFKVGHTVAFYLQRRFYSKLRHWRRDTSKRKEDAQVTD